MSGLSPTDAGSTPVPPQSGQMVPPPPSEQVVGQAASGQPMAPMPQASGYRPPAPATGLAIAGLICAFVAPPIGLVLSIIALVKRRKAGASIGLALTGLIISVLALIAITVGIVMAVNMLTQLAAICAELGPGVWQQGPVTYTCG